MSMRKQKVSRARITPPYKDSLEDYQLLGSDADGTLIFVDGLPTLGSPSGGSGTPASTVESETSYGQSDSVGVSTDYARADHTHGTPYLPTAGDIGAEVAGTAAILIASHEAASDPHTVYQKESEKGASSGYASLDGSTKVPIAQLPTGTTGSTVALGNIVSTHESTYTHSNLPSTDEKAALIGTAGTPSVTNKYVTDTDTRVTGAATAAALATEVSDRISADTALAAPDYLVKTATGTLSAERVVTDTASITADWGTAGQVKFVREALTGDVTAPQGSNTTTLASVIAAGSAGSATQTPVVTVDVKGRVTGLSATTVAPAWNSITATPTTLAGYGITDAQSYNAYLLALAGASQAITANTTLSTQRAQLFVNGSWQITFPTVSSWQIGVPTIIAYRGTTEATIVLIADAADKIEGATCAALVGSDILATIIPVAANKWMLSVDRGIALWQHAAFDLTSAAGASPWAITNSVVSGTSTFTDISSASSSVTASSGLLMTAASSTTLYGSGAATGAVVRTPISGLLDGWSRPLLGNDDFWVLTKSSRSVVTGNVPDVQVGICGSALSTAPRVLTLNGAVGNLRTSIRSSSTTTTINGAESSTTSANWLGFEYNGAARLLMESLLSTAPSGTPGTVAGWWPTSYLSTSGYRWGSDFVGGTALWTPTTLSDIWLGQSNVTTGTKWLFSDLVVMRVVRGK